MRITASCGFEDHYGAQRAATWCLGESTQPPISQKDSGSRGLIGGFMFAKRLANRLVSSCTRSNGTNNVQASNDEIGADRPDD